ncbi:MAG: hypothetical protein WC683_07130 [bacterium]
MAFLLGLVFTTAAVLGIGLSWALQPTPADGPQLQYIYQVTLEPSKGGPTLICAELPIELGSSIVRIKDIRGMVVFIRDIPLYILRSEEPMDVEALRRKLNESVLKTQEART